VTNKLVGGATMTCEVGPGKHFFGCGHTLANYEHAFWTSDVADNNSFEQWRDDGAKGAPARANVRWKRLLAEYEQPKLDPAIDEALGALDRDRLNVHGGSLGAGHPFGATGGRIVASLAKALSETDPARPARGLISICAAGGLGVTAIMEAPAA